MPPKKAAAKAPAKGAAKKPSAKAAATKVGSAKRPRSSSATSTSQTSMIKGAVKIAPPVDEHCKLVSGHVYVDSDGHPWSVKLNQTNIGHNNNKYYIIQLIQSSPASVFACFTRWGRVGEAGQQSTETGSLEAMQLAFARKFKDKTRNDWGNIRTKAVAFVPSPGKYDLVETDSSGSSAVPLVVSSPGSKVTKVKASKLSVDVQKVLALIFDRDMFKNKMKEKNIDANRMPLGKLTAGQVSRGYETLEAIEKMVNKRHKTGKDATDLQVLSSKFYTVIPHDFGRHVPPVINTPEMVTEKYDLLNLLNDIQIAVAVDEAVGKKIGENPIDEQYKELGCKLDAVDASSAEYSMIDTYTKETQGYRKCTIRRAFRVDRPEDKQRMEQHHKTEREGRYLLWHGTNVAVVAAILKTGLRIMPHAGGRVGRGLYFASENGKSSSYVGCHGKTGIMFLVEVCMGKSIHRILSDDSSLDLKKVQEMQATSVLACGRQEPNPSMTTTLAGEWGPIAVPQGKPQAQKGCETSSFTQSEYLVYEESRARIKYLLEMDF